MRDVTRYLKRHTEVLVKDVGVEAACEVIGKSKATLGRYYSTHDEHSERFIPIDSVIRLEGVASFPHVTVAMAELSGLTVGLDPSRHADDASPGHLHEDIAVTAERFAHLMKAYARAVADNVVTPAEARNMLFETMELQRILVRMKLHLEAENCGEIGGVKRA